MYRSRRPLIHARNIVATSQPLAAQAGIEMLRRGGNAIDGALAAAIALTVVEPTSNGIGSDAFALVWDGSALHGLNASGRSPAAMTAERFAGRDKMPLRGWEAVTVPGAVSAWVELHERFGVLAFSELFEPAIRYAERGFAVGAVTALAWSAAAWGLRSMPDFAAAFLRDGQAPEAGALWRFPEQGRTLRRIAESRGEAFYRGDLAAAMVAHSDATGGLLAAADLESHRPEWVEPLRVSFGDAELFEIPPNGQGIAALLACGILDRTDVAEHPVDSATSLHLQIEAMKLGFADAHRYVSDPRTADVDPRALLEPGYLDRRAALVGERAGVHPPGIPNRGGTVYLTTADADGRMVSFIQSNYWGFGSGIVVPGTGISLQNRAAGFTLEAGHPNQVGPSKRPFHTIIPAFAFRDGAPWLSFGVMGGPMQPQGHTQMMVRMALHGQDPQTASDAPRWRVIEDGSVRLEAGTAPAVAEGLRALGHDAEIAEPSESVAFGGAQLIENTGDGYRAGSDHRKEGQAVGF